MEFRMGTIHYAGRHHQGTNDRGQWVFGPELEGGLREWIMTQNGRIYHWGILLENTYVDRMTYGINDQSLEMRMFPQGELSGAGSQGPLVLDASRSDTVERLMQRCLQLEAENQQLKAWQAAVREG